MRALDRIASQITKPDRLEEVAPAASIQAGSITGTIILLRRLTRPAVPRCSTHKAV